MNASTPVNSMERLLARAGSRYLLAVLVLATLPSYPIAALAALTIYANAELSVPQSVSAGVFTAIMLVTANALLITVMYAVARDARRRLAQWQRGSPLSSGDDAELRAWRQVNNLPIYVAILGSINSVALIIAPLLLYERFVLFLSNDQLIYTFFGSSVSSLAITSLYILLTDQMLRPARQVLLPVGFQNQLAGARGLRLIIKALYVILSLISVAILLIAPIGYHQTIRVLYTEIGSIRVLSDLQFQSVLVSVGVLLLGSLLGWLLIRAITTPVRELIDVFGKVEAGDLKQRASVQSGNELGELAVYFNRMLSRLDELQGNLERQVAERTAQLEAVNEVGRVASSILDPADLVSQVVRLITDRFDYYYAAIFMISPDGHWAELRDATGTAGETLKARHHRLEIGGRSMVSTAIETRQARVALDVGQEAVRFNNPLLPETRSEIALPLMVGERVLGALDVQSTREAAFGETEIRTLQGMANQVAIALENARLFQETQASLEESRSIQRQYLGDAWTRVAAIHGSSLEYVSEQPGASSGAASKLELPLALRDQIIGQIHLESDEEISPDERSWIEAIATQAALALENARLLEESQEQSTRDRLLSEITRRIWQTPTIEGILQATVREVGRALNANEATIRIGGPSPKGQEHV